MKFVLLVLLLLSFGVEAEKLRNIVEIDVVPAKYGKYGITPIVGPITEQGVQQTTLVFNKEYGPGVISQAKIHFYSSKKLLILTSDNHYQCKQAKCFLEYDITPDYQNNIEIELIYAHKKYPDRLTKYTIKDIGLLTNHFNRKW